MSTPPRRIARPADPERDRILSAARAMLAEESAVTALGLDTLAARAGVARAQMQKQFGTLAGVLEALWDRLVSDGCLAQLPRAFALEDPAQAVDELIAIHARLWDAERKVVRRVRAFAALDADLERALRVREHDRREGLRRFAPRLASGPLGAKVMQELVGVLALVTAFEMIDTLAGPDRPIADVVPELQAIARALLARVPR